MAVWEKALVYDCSWENLWRISSFNMNGVENITDTVDSGDIRSLSKDTKHSVYLICEHDNILCKKVEEIVRYFNKTAEKIVIVSETSIDIKTTQIAGKDIEILSLKEKDGVEKLDTMLEDYDGANSGDFEYTDPKMLEMRRQFEEELRAARAA